LKAAKRIGSVDVYVHMRVVIIVAYVPNVGVFFRKMRRETYPLRTFEHKQRLSLHSS
jgi:hypothetical protein